MDRGGGRGGSWQGPNSGGGQNRPGNSFREQIRPGNSGGGQFFPNQSHANQQFQGYGNQQQQLGHGPNGGEINFNHGQFRPNNQQGHRQGNQQQFQGNSNFSAPVGRHDNINQRDQQGRRNYQQQYRPVNKVTGSTSASSVPVQPNTEARPEINNENQRPPPVAKVATAETEDTVKKSQCFKCGDSGHNIRECEKEASCIICGKDTHATKRCPWPSQNKPVARMVGWAAPDLGFFVAENAKTPTTNKKMNLLALIEVQEGEISAEDLEKDFALMFPWDWKWKALEHDVGKFLMRFPDVDRIEQLSRYKKFFLITSGILVNVSRWSTQAVAKGRLHSVWVRASNVPEELKNFHGLHEVGSMIGAVEEVDMESLRELDLLRFKVLVKIIEAIPTVAELVVKPFLYDIFFMVESVAEYGYMTQEKNKRTADERMKPREQNPQQSHSRINEQGQNGSKSNVQLEQGRSPKRSRNVSIAVQTDENEEIPEKRKCEVIANSCHNPTTHMVSNDAYLAVRGTNMESSGNDIRDKPHDEIMGTEKDSSITRPTSEETTPAVGEEKTGEWTDTNMAVDNQGVENSNEMNYNSERVQLEGSESLDLDESQESQSFAQKVGVTLEDSQEDKAVVQGGKNTQRVDRAIERAKAKNLEPADAFDHPKLPKRLSSGIPATSDARLTSSFISLETGHDCFAQSALACGYASQSIGSEDFGCTGTSTFNKKACKKLKQSDVSEEVEIFYTEVFCKRVIKEPKATQEERPFITIDGSHVTYTEFYNSLKCDGKLSENVMQLYTHFFNEAAKEVSNVIGFRKIALPPFFLRKLYGPTPALRPKDVQKLDSALDLSAADLLFFPLTLACAQQWLLLCINRREPSVSFFDPANLMPDNDSTHNFINTMLGNFSKVCRDANVFKDDFESFPVKRLLDYPKPNQPCLVDYGFYIISCLINWHGTLKFHKDYILHLRKQIAYDLVHSSLNKTKSLTMLPRRTMMTFKKKRKERVE